jgi:CBS domain containing-hemolysin-like protein
VGSLLLPPVRWTHLLFGPLLRPISSRMVPRAPAAAPLGPEEAEALLRGEDAMDLAPDERTLVRHVLELGKLRSGALRVPLARIVQVPAEEPLGLARRRMERAGVVHALVTDARGEVIGALDLSLAPRGARAVDAMIRVPILPEVAPATNGIGLLRDSGAPFLLLVDEYGQASGVVPRGRWADTLLDRLPKFGGSSVLREISPGRFQADATLALHDFEDRFGAPGDIDVRVETLGGLLSDRLGRVAREGDRLTFDGPGFRGEIWVTRADETGPEMLEIWVNAANPDEEGTES